MGPKRPPLQEIARHQTIVVDTERDYPVLKYVGVASVVLAICLVGSLLWSSNLRLQVAAKTAEACGEFVQREEVMADLTVAKHAAEAANRAKS